MKKIDEWEFQGRTWGIFDPADGSCNLFIGIWDGTTWRHGDLGSNNERNALCYRVRYLVGGSPTVNTQDPARNFML